MIAIFPGKENKKNKKYVIFAKQNIVLGIFKDFFKFLESFVNIFFFVFMILLY